MTGCAGADRAIASLIARGQTIAVAESLTGGLLTSCLVDISGASAAVRGGVVAYATPLKVSVLGVSRALLAEHGAVHADVALAMARGVRDRLAVDGQPADVGLATTGVAGPEPQDGAPVGLAFVAVSDARGDEVRELRLTGSRAAIRSAAADAAIALLLERLDARE